MNSSVYSRSSPRTIATFHSFMSICRARRNNTIKNRQKLSSFVRPNLAARSPSVDSKNSTSWWFTASQRRAFFSIWLQSRCAWTWRKPLAQAQTKWTELRKLLLFFSPAAINSYPPSSTNGIYVLVIASIFRYVNYSTCLHGCPTDS